MYGNKSSSDKAWIHDDQHFLRCMEAKGFADKHAQVYPDEKVKKKKLKNRYGSGKINNKFQKSTF